MQKLDNTAKSKALIQAAQRGDLATVKNLLSEHGLSLSVNARDEHGRTALHYAAMEGNKDIINVLMHYDAVINLVDNDGKNPISVAKYFSVQLHMIDKVARLQPWVADDDVRCCQHCDKIFTVQKRRHHCRLCGRVVCKKCSGYKAPIQKLLITRPRRLCILCCAVVEMQDAKLKLNEEGPVDK